MPYDSGVYKSFSATSGSQQQKVEEEKVDEKNIEEITENSSYYN